jgi:sortase A
LAVIRIEKLNIEVFDGTDDLTLNRGVRRIISTAKLGVPAGHRDGFFGGLKDISVGDQVNLMMTTTRDAYVVDEIEIVSPADASRTQSTVTSALKDQNNKESTKWIHHN